MYKRQNPYLVFAVCLAAGLDGIQKKIYPTKASNRSLSESDQKEQGIENLPENLREAITLFEDSSWMKEILGEAFCKQYAQAKRKEWLRYSQEISDWEIEEILIKTSRFPVFWQFIGLYGEEYGVLNHLDEIDGRHTQNAAFLKMEDFDDFMDSGFYRTIFANTAAWLEELDRKQMLP